MGKVKMGELILIAAASENNALGLNNDLPWHLPDDFKRFRKLTTDHKIIMGRKTLESFPRLLPNREHVVISRDKNYKPKYPVTLFHSLEEAIAYVKNDAVSFIIGGGQIYKQAMSIATKIELTRVHTEVEADTYFPEIDSSQWKLVNEEHHPRDERHKYAFTFLTFERKA